MILLSVASSRRLPGWCDIRASLWHHNQECRIKETEYRVMKIDFKVTITRNKMEVKSNQIRWSHKNNKVSTWVSYCVMLSVTKKICLHGVFCTCGIHHVRDDKCDVIMAWEIKISKHLSYLALQPAAFYSCSSSWSLVSDVVGRNRFHNKHMPVKMLS